MTKISLVLVVQLSNKVTKVLRNYLTKTKFKFSRSTSMQNNLEIDLAKKFRVISILMGSSLNKTT